MSKAILIINMPKCCSECRFLNDNYDYPECIVTGETREYTFRTEEQKMDKCPLKSAPELAEIYYNNNELDWEGMLIGNCFNCLYIEDGSKIGKDGWLNCLKWGAANINPYGFCHMWEPKRQ